jgi:hypothetical protein
MDLDDKNWCSGSDDSALGNNRPKDDDIHSKSHDFESWSPLGFPVIAALTPKQNSLLPIYLAMPFSKPSKERRLTWQIYPEN